MNDLPVHSAVRLADAFDKRAKGIEWSKALQRARELYETVVAGETLPKPESAKVIAEMLMRTAELAVAAERRTVLLTAKVQVLGAIAQAEREQKKANDVAREWAERLVDP